MTDTERLDWLEANGTSPHYYTRNGETYWWMSDRNGYPISEDYPSLREAIDAAAAPHPRVVRMSRALRLALSSHDAISPCTPAELRKLAGEMEESLIEHECGFSHPDWRYVDGLWALSHWLEANAAAPPREGAV